MRDASVDIPLQKPDEIAAFMKSDFATNAELIKVAALRQLKEAPVVEPPHGAYDEFVARFPYEETEDQAASIQSVLDDLGDAVGSPRNDGKARSTRFDDGDGQRFQIAGQRKHRGPIQHVANRIARQQSRQLNMIGNSQLADLFFDVAAQRAIPDQRKLRPCMPRKLR